MRFLLALVSGRSGRPTHPPLTDLVIGGYTIGTFAAVSSWLGWQEQGMAIVAAGAISVGAVSALPTSITGLLDWLKLAKGSPARRLGLWHLALIFISAPFYVMAGIRIYGGQAFNLEVEPVDATSAMLCIVGWIVLALGASMGGKLTFLHGVRVVHDGAQSR
jgi:uncharacterized membrane protein